MKRNTSIPSVIAKFREQRQRMKKLLIAFAILVIVGVMAPLFLSTLPALQNNPPWKGIMLTLGVVFGIACVVLTFAASFNQMCPACGKPLGEDFWSIRYCPHCGTKLRDD